jgi:ATP-dependent RNA helicase DHX57
VSWSNQPYRRYFSSASSVDLINEGNTQELAKFPQADDDQSLVLADMQTENLLKQLQQLGFKTAQARKAVAYLSEPSPLAANLLRSASSLNACIEYIILNIPEVDLPPRFLPSQNSSNPFVTGLHGTADDLSKRWIEERAVKLGGWPAHIVRECTKESELAGSWAHLIFALNRRLAGENWMVALSSGALDVSTELEDQITAEDIESMGAHWDQNDKDVLVMPLFSAPVQLNFVIPSHIEYNRSTHPPPMYITSAEAPAYVRLHLLAQVLGAFKTGAILDGGFGILLGAMQIVDEQWALVEDEGPPDIALVMQHLMPQQNEDEEDTPDFANSTRKPRRRGGVQRRDGRTDAQVQADFKETQRNRAYQDMLETRQRLPAFKSKDEFLAMLNSSRVVVVVGETGAFSLSIP